MRRHVFLIVTAFALVATACGDDDTGPAAPPTATAAPPTATAAPPTATAATGAPQPTTAAPVATAAPVTTVAPTATTAPAPTTPEAPPAEPSVVFAITSVSVSPAGQDVVIANIGNATGNLKGFVLCQFPNYHDFGDIELAPGEFVAVSLGGDVFLPPPGAKETTTANIGTIRADDGEIALFTRRDFGNSDAIVDYVEWGKDDHTRSGVAVGAGIWNSGDFVATEGSTVFLFANTSPTDGAEDWTAG